ncbi:MAG: serine hydrolase [Flavobacteriaceae bacterium]|nr:serine hydrolase [Flavobacteriaceae bacterium]
MRVCLVAFLFLFFNCEQQQLAEDPIEAALDSENSSISKVIDQAEQYEVQIMLSTINRKGESIFFNDYQYAVNDSVYFYPASTVKFPIAVLALEKVNSMADISSETIYVLESDSVKHTIRDDIRQIFAVSDNEAYNRLYEFLGRDYINSKLREKGISPVRISHRLSVPNSNYPVTKPISFWENDTIIYIQDSISNNPVESIKLKKQTKGVGFYEDSILVQQPMVFSEKNYLPITALHKLMKRVIFPEAFPENETFDLNGEDRTFLLNSMKALPRESGYNPEEFYDSYGKFFIFGDNKDPIPSNFEIYNKVGYAYGYLTDVAYIKDTDADIEYVLTATIHVNENGIFNDDTYEYDSIGIPFLANLGREIHQQLINLK